MLTTMTFRSFRAFSENQLTYSFLKKRDSFGKALPKFKIQIKYKSNKSQKLDKANQLCDIKY